MPAPHMIGRMRTDLERFFNPAAIAIVGASQDLGTISGQPLKHLQAHGYKGRLYPVNPRYPRRSPVLPRWHTMSGDAERLLRT